VSIGIQCIISRNEKDPNEKKVRRQISRWIRFILNQKEKETISGDKNKVWWR